MGIDIVLEDENGTAIASVSDYRGALAKLRPDPDDRAFRCVGFIDPYGDTVFNSVQTPYLRRELAILFSSATDAYTVELRGKIDALITQAESDVHQYLTFYGD